MFCYCAETTCAPARPGRGSHAPGILPPAPPGKPSRGCPTPTLAVRPPCLLVCVSFPPSLGSLRLSYTGPLLLVPCPGFEIARPLAASCGWSPFCPSSQGRPGRLRVTCWSPECGRWCPQSSPCSGALTLALCVRLAGSPLEVLAPPLCSLRSADPEPPPPPFQPLAGPPLTSPSGTPPAFQRPVSSFLLASLPLSHRVLGSASASGPRSSWVL